MPEHHESPPHWLPPPPPPWLACGLMVLVLMALLSVVSAIFWLGECCVRIWRPWP